MRKLILLAVLFLGISSISYAQNFPRENDNKAGYSNIAYANPTVTTATVSRPALVYGVTAYSDAANSHCDLYDKTSAPVSGDYPKVEVGSATQYASNHAYYDPPISFTNGVYLKEASGSCYVEYR